MLGREPPIYPLSTPAHTDPSGDVIGGYATSLVRSIATSSAAAAGRDGFDSMMLEKLEKDSATAAENIPPIRSPSIRVIESAAGFKGGHGVPFSLQREIAQEQNREFFVTGRLGENAGVWTASYAVHDAARGRTLDEGILTGSDPMVLADELSLALRHDLEVPAAHIEQSTDLPVSEIFTGVGQASEAYGRAMEALLVDSDYAQADSLLAVAVEADPGFAVGYMARYVVALFGGQSELATASLEAAVDNIYRLPERDRFQVNAELHLIRQQPERARMAFQMKVELFPDDIRGPQDTL